MSKKTDKYWDIGWQLMDGCTKCSPGCLHCWSESMAARLHAEDIYVDGCPGGSYNWHGTIRLNHNRLKIIGGKPKTITIWNDPFHEKVPFGFIDRVNAIIALCRQHTFMVLTKRIERMEKYFVAESSKLGGFTERIIRESNRYIDNKKYDEFYEYMRDKQGILPNLWLGTTIETWEQWDRAKILSEIPAYKRYWSIEPLLGEFPHQLPPEKTDWIIIGAETGQGRRPCKLEWFEPFIEYADLYNIPVWVKAIELNGKIVKDITQFPKFLQRRESPTFTTENTEDTKL
ncbi:MAG: DUF5131 family protein [Phycisphaerae bacterium]|nr:DUF5131 family protein [Phycisphaerae bacterium]